jgi:hypothetical protein
MRITSRSLFIFALACLPFLHFETMAQNDADSPSYEVGMQFRRFVPKEPFNWRGAQTHALTTVIWYPAAAAKEEAVKIPGLDIFDLGTGCHSHEIPSYRHFARYGRQRLEHGLAR